MRKREEVAGKWAAAAAGGAANAPNGKREKRVALGVKWRIVSA